MVNPIKKNDTQSLCLIWLAAGRHDAVFDKCSRYGFLLPDRPRPVKQHKNATVSAFLIFQTGRYIFIGLK
jgi:hypothetical protein